MAVNQKAVKVLNKVLEAGFTDEKAIAAMTMDDILSMQGITVGDITLINDLQKSIKSNKVISFLALIPIIAGLYRCWIWFDPYLGLHLFKI